MPLILRESQVDSLLDMSEGLRIVEESFRQHAQGKVALAPRVALKLSGKAGAFRVMAASLPEMSTFGLKTLTGIPGRRHRDRIYFAILLFDGATGALTCVLPAGRITSIRTGAAGGVAVKHLARPDCRTIGVFGAGVQARAQIDAIKLVRPIETVKVFDIVEEAAEGFAADLGQQGIHVELPATPRETVASSDIVVCATTSKEPLVFGDWLEEGVHVNSIGANSPTKRELDAEAFQKGKVVVDYQEQVLIEAGDLIEAISSGAITEDRIHAELGEVIDGGKAGRESPEEITIFKSVGVPFQDIAVASWVFKAAKEKGLGIQVKMEQ